MCLSLGLPLITYTFEGSHSCILPPLASNLTTPLLCSPPPAHPAQRDPVKTVPKLSCQALLTSFWISLLRAEIFIFMSSSSWSGKGCTWGLASDSSGDGNTKSARGMYHLQSYCWCFLQTSPEGQVSQREAGSSVLNHWAQNQKITQMGSTENSAEVRRMAALQELG